MAGAGVALLAVMAWLHQARRVSGPQPSDSATTRMEAARGPPSVAWRSRTILIARSRSSGVNFLGMIRFSFRKLGTKPRALQTLQNLG